MSTMIFLEFVPNIRFLRAVYLLPRTDKDYHHEVHFEIFKEKHMLCPDMRELEIALRSGSRILRVERRMSLDKSKRFNMFLYASQMNSI